MLQSLHVPHTRCSCGCSNARGSECGVRISLRRTRLCRSPMSLQLNHLRQSRPSSRRRVHLDDRDENLSIRSSLTRWPMALGACRRSVLLHLQPLASHHLYGDRDNHDGFERPCGSSCASDNRSYAALVPPSCTGAFTESCSLSQPDPATSATECLGQGCDKRGLLCGGFRPWRKASERMGRALQRVREGRALWWLETSGCSFPGRNSLWRDAWRRKVPRCPRNLNNAHTDVNPLGRTVCF